MSLSPDQFAEDCRSQRDVVPSVGVRPEDRLLIEAAAASHHLVDMDDVRAAGLTPRQWQTRVRAGEWVPVAEADVAYRCFES